MNLEELSREFYALDTSFLFDSHNLKEIVDLIQRILDVDVDRIFVSYFFSFAFNSPVLSFTVDRDEYYLIREHVSLCKYLKKSTELIYQGW